MKNILAIVGSATANSSNLELVKKMAELSKGRFNMTIFDRLSGLPHFDPALTSENTPDKIVAVRKLIEAADGILFSTPEYIFSIPAGLKNLLEWCVSTTLFSQKPVAVITASANGEKGHEELKMILRTVESVVPDNTTLLIKGIRAKLDPDGRLTDPATLSQIEDLLMNFHHLIENNGHSQG
jgi:NAD(P)H-dependent FMN reductase